MDTIWYHGIIMYLQKKCLFPKDIHTDTVATLGNDAPALAIVQRWAAEFRRGWESINMTQGLDVHRLPPLRKILIMFITWWLTINEIVNGISLSRVRVENILLNELGMTKVFAQRIPRLLILDQKLNRLIQSRENLTLFAADSCFLECFLTQDECWVHYFEPETKR